tara:strand:- start:978 stop:1724 length:747 start_codon:yes stop_codon:yes gene_type:complete
MSGLAIAGMALQAGSAGMSFYQANKQKIAQGKAEEKANELLEDAKKRLDVNKYEALAIQKEPYELQREALLSQGAAGLQAGVEGSQRGAAATAGRVQMAQQAAQGGVRTAMGQEMMDLDKLVAAEDSRLLDVGMQLGLEESASARQAARDASNARQQAIMSGVQGIAGIGETAISQAELYAGTAKQPIREDMQKIDMLGMPTLPTPERNLAGIKAPFMQPLKEQQQPVFYGGVNPLYETLNPFINPYL